jgi:hypothetical protein
MPTHQDATGYGYTTKNEEKTFEIFKKFGFRIYRDCMNLIYNLKYSEPT